MRQWLLLSRPITLLANVGVWLRAKQIEMVWPSDAEAKSKLKQTHQTFL